MNESSAGFIRWPIMEAALPSTTISEVVPQYAEDRVMFFPKIFTFIIGMKLRLGLVAALSPKYKSFCQTHFADAPPPSLKLDVV